MKKAFVYFLVFILTTGIVSAGNAPEKKVLVLVEGEYNLKNQPSAIARQVVQLLGHFKAVATINSISNYHSRDVEKFDMTFYIGMNPVNKVPSDFCNDVLKTKKQIVWLNSGFAEFSKNPEVEKHFGFSVSKYDVSTPYYLVKTPSYVYAKGTPDLSLIQIKNKEKVEVWGQAFAAKSKKESPYMVRSGNLVYVADLPFLEATKTDRYIYFCEKLHDIMGEKHATQHQAVIRIEDVTPLHDPNRLREIADILSERGIPFLVGVVPIYVNPSQDRRVTLTEKPEVVDALKYMVRNGGTIVMHGVTHQYRGVSTADCEFWDDQANKPIAGESRESISQKLELGIDEFFKNGLYPITWETPHYEGSMKSYEVFTKYFGTVIEQRMAIDNLDDDQYFPYIINKDIYGQRIFPENMGYVPLSASMDSSRMFVKDLLKNSEALHQVSDGIASCFFHPFLQPQLLKELVDGIKAQGYTFTNLRDVPTWVKAHDKIILSGAQSYKLPLDNEFLHEIYFDSEGKITKKLFSKERIKGEISKKIDMEPGCFYMAEGVDYQIKEPTLKDKVIQQLHTTYSGIFGTQKWREARVGILWNQYSRGAAYYDQASLASVFASLNINLDTTFLRQDVSLDSCNLLVVPYASVDSLTYFDIAKIVKFVKNGGNLITDRKNKLAEKLGIVWFNSEAKLHVVRDKYFPMEYISWNNNQLTNKIDYKSDDEIFCEDAATGLPVVIGRTFGKGKLIYFNTAFDPFTEKGYSNYPFAMEYVKRYFQLSPVFKRENLEFYFEPDYRKSTSIEDVVKLWVKDGIRIVHVGAWHEYEKYTYDYKRLIKLAHANGILVYAWLEPPYVSVKFWKKHPEWREKNFKGEDINGKEIKSSWRLPVAMTDPKCMSAVIDEYTNFFKSYDFDGVNIAELHFEAGPDGFKQPEFFAPMHPSARAEFKKKYGFDLKDIFNTTSEYYWNKNPKAKEDVINFRVDKVAAMHETLLQLFNKIAKTKNGFGIMVTSFDTYFSPEIKENLGGSSEKMIELQKKYGFLLQIEDPASKWSTDPTRYNELGKFYAKKISDPSKLLVDLNIYTLRKKDQVTPFPTLLQTGIESYHLINSAALGAPRFTVYSEATCNPQDLNYFSYASSAQVQYEYTEDGYNVKSPYSFEIQLPVDIKVIRVDGQSVLGYRDNTFIIPAGEHEINTRSKDIAGFSFSAVELQPQILSFSGNLLDIQYDMRQVNFTYESTERTLVSLTRLPTTVRVDSVDYKFEVEKGNDCYSLFLPVGKHRVEIVTGDKFTYGMNLTSLWSVSAIAIYGVIAVILLVLMYLSLKLLRKRLEN